MKTPEGSNVVRIGTKPEPVVIDGGGVPLGAADATVSPFWSKNNHGEVSLGVELQGVTDIVPGQLSRETLLHIIGERVALELQNMRNAAAQESGQEI